MTDDHAAHAIGAYGSRVNQTPNLDRLARRRVARERVRDQLHLHAEPRGDPDRPVFAHQRRHGVQSLRQLADDRRAPAAEGRLLHRDDRQVAPGQRSGRLRSMGDPPRPGRLQQPASLHGHRRKDLHRPLCDRRHHRPRHRLRAEAPAQPAVFPDGPSQGATPSEPDAVHAAQFASRRIPNRRRSGIPMQRGPMPFTRTGSALRPT